MEKRPSQTAKQFSIFATSLELGFYLSIPVVVGALGGKLLDGWFDTRPWLLIAGTIIGIAIATGITVQKVTGMIAKVDEEYEHEKQEKEKNIHE